MTQPLKHGQRIERRDIERISTISRWIVLGENQYFCETQKAWEIWGPLEDEPNGLIRFIKRFPKKSVYWITEK